LLNGDTHDNIDWEVSDKDAGGPRVGSRAPHVCFDEGQRVSGEESARVSNTDKSARER